MTKHIQRPAADMQERSKGRASRLFGSRTSGTAFTFAEALRGHRRGGFTLIELIVVMAIIALLFAMVIGTMDYAKRRAKESQAQSQIQQLQDGLQKYYTKFGRYPTTLAAVSNYMDSGFTLVDPWGKQYSYSFAATNPHSFVLYSFGYDGTNDTADDIRAGG